jgi:superfamily II DNA or RNA helicase
MRKHQSDALAAIRNSDLGQISLPTGTGKTFVQIALHTDSMLQSTEPGTYVIAAHRLELCSQLLDSFLDLLIRCNVKFDILFVGSTTFNLNNLKTKYFGISDVLDRIASTSTLTSEDITRAKNRAYKHKRHLIVVSTYDSFDRLSVIDPIEICTYDEAHTTITEEFSDNIAKVRPNIKRNYFFTATRKVIGLTQGMNNQKVYGDVIYEVSPRAMIDAGEIVQPKLHLIEPEDDGNFANEGMLIRTILEGFTKHKSCIKGNSANPTKLGAKLLVTTEGTEELVTILKNPFFKDYCIQNKIKVVSFSSTSGYTYNFDSTDRSTVRSEMQKLKIEEDAILLHIDILTEGIDLPAVTGVMSFRPLSESKLLQTLGRAARLVNDDRNALYSGAMVPTDYSKFLKPYCYLIIPSHFWDSVNESTTINMIEEIMNSYEIPVEDIGIPDRFLALDGIDLQNVTAKDHDNKSAKLTDLDHKISNILKDISLRKFLNKSKEHASDYDTFLERLTSKPDHGLMDQLLSPEETKTLIGTKEGRECLIDETRRRVPSWQDQKTPRHIGEETIELLREEIPETETNDYLYVVLFSLEYLDVVTFDYKAENVLFVADSTAEAIIAKNVYGCSVEQISQKDNLEEFMKKLRKKANEKFKGKKLIVLGNPPYQKQAEGSQSSVAAPIYNEFIIGAIDHLKPEYVSMIVPSRWMQGGIGLTEFRERMLQSKQLKFIKHFQGGSEVFPTVDIKGGVNYFLWSSKHKGNCKFNGVMRDLSKYDVVITEKESSQILDKVTGKYNTFLNDKVLSINPFGVMSNHNKWSNEGYKCISKGRKETYIDPDLVNDKFNVVNKYKVCTAKAADGGSPDKQGKRYITKNIFLVEPNSIVTHSYVVLGTFDYKEEAENFKVYCESKFFRFLLGLRVTSQDVSKEKFSWVPDMLDYTQKWDDEALIKHFKLTKAEVEYIEARIK